MGIQFVIKAERNIIESALGDLYSDCEVFPISSGVFGLSIPASIIDKVGEEVVFKKLEKMERFWLWLGQWQK